MGSSLEFKDLISIVMKRWKILLIIPIVCGLIGFSISYFILTPVYRVQADLLVNQTITDQDQPATTDVEMNLRLIETYQFIINSSRVRELVRDQLAGDYQPEEFGKKFSVETSPDTQIISLYAEDSDPEIASDMVNLYASIAQKEISELMQLDNVRLLTEAKAENFPVPVQPTPALYTIISFMAGAGLALIYITLSAYFNTKIHTRQDVERYLGVPLLGSIGMFSKREGKYQDGKQDFFQLISRTNKNKPDLESFRTLRTNIQFQRSVKKLSSILVTSTQKNEGKTVSAGNLAIAMALDDKKTVLIDADLRKLSWSSPDDNDLNAGLTHYLSGSMKMEDMLIDTSIPNLSMINSGPLPPNPTELIASSRMDQLLSELEGTFDIIIIDSPPMVFSDAAVLAAKVDGSVFISSAGTTKVAHAQQAIKQLKTVHATILGAVLNNKKEKKKAASY